MSTLIGRIRQHSKALAIAAAYAAVLGCTPTSDNKGVTEFAPSNRVSKHSTPKMSPSDLTSEERKAIMYADLVPMTYTVSMSDGTQEVLRANAQTYLNSYAGRKTFESAFMKLANPDHKTFPEVSKEKNGATRTIQR